MLAALATVVLVASGGLRGTVTRGPTMPVCRAGTPCTAPAAHTVLVFRRSGRVARTTTDAGGRYRIALAPGIWTVGLSRTGIGAALTPHVVRVRAGSFFRVDFSVDTGIR